MLAETEKYQNNKSCDKKKSLKKSKPSWLDERKKMLIVKKKKTPQKIVRCADEMKILLTAHTQIHRTPVFVSIVCFPSPYRCIIVAILLLWRGKQTLENKTKENIKRYGIFFSQR